MTQRRIFLLLLCIFIVQSIAQDIRSVEMSTMIGWQFQCSATTCLPFVTLIVSDILVCQMACLAQIQCQAVSFHQTNSKCELFNNIQSQINNMVIDINTLTMTTITGTRFPPG